MAIAPARLDLPGRYGVEGRSEWLDVDWSEHVRSAQIEGRRLNFVDVGAGPPLVFVHGLGGCWQNWLENIPHFARSRRVIAPDLPGFGGSEMPAEKISMHGYARALDALLAELGVDEPAVVVGNSMGGFVAAELAIAYAHRVERLSLVAAAILWQERRRARPLLMLSKSTKAVAAIGAAQWELAFRRPRARELIMSQVVRHPRRISKEMTWELMQGSGTPGFPAALEAFGTYSIRDRLPEIAAPTLIVWGTDDAQVPVDHAYEFDRLIPDTRLLILEDTGHVPMVERPEVFNAALDEFLAEEPNEDVPGRGP
jgi:pimeloyl-ACP methyl ester carboxylesterase